MRRATPDGPTGSGTAELRQHVTDRLRRAGCVFAEDEAALILADASDRGEVGRMLAARESGTPLEHVLGWADFCGLRLSVAPGVFVPRRRTEVVVHAAVAVLRPGALVVDLCCGSGAIGAAVAHRVARARVMATDIDEVAVRCARSNLEPYAGSVHLGDLLDPLPREARGEVDAVVASPPYVPSDAIATMPLEAREHERRHALDGGDDGLAVVRRIAASAPGWLAAGGHVLVETSEDQADGAAEALRSGGLTAKVRHDGELGGTVVVGSR